ncbi:MAG: GTP-binding protein YchF [Candidatus Pacebacteria bacterium GW2011_GWF2_38_9]|nr:MAG: GTP-binding protein YchF [candidate division TM6 bacterium GW2011_GWF2_28_16]KKQ08844.1 MAG: GTP-binding protein YchF [Candidatus Pacebacteria bacterium GW2011_GWF1_36_5]KKQ89125.1 MAG: GTP-binding protein YchF [Candidatus Pacebacteria bacterium GW2011_GWF2_38_9]
MNLQIGIVGLPNVGKSTLFNALLKKQVALAANYPFATIEPNVGVVEVPDSRLPKLAEVTKTSEKLPNLPPLKYALVEFVDIAGLVAGASKGEGLGNKFLANIRETDAICHVLRHFSDPNVLREGSVDPEQDLTIIRTELQLADLETLQKQHQPKGAVSKDEKDKWETIQDFLAKIEQGQSLVCQSEVEKLVAKELCLLTAKPEIFAINVDEKELVKTQELTELFAKKLQVKKEQIVIISAKIESELAVLAAEDQELYMQELGIKESGLSRLAAVAYQTLGLQSFLTTGEIESKAWTIRKGSTAQEAAGVIHTDFSKKFISAKIINFKEFVELGGWSACKEIGKIRQEGRDYVMQDGDVVEFMIGK